ncbi:MAG: T9SS type A sorting domain-containing protein [Prevotella sp.]|nr:T9SS type A sorting domain-containing protein [Prevotella sp.]
MKKIKLGLAVGLSFIAMNIHGQEFKSSYIQQWGQTYTDMQKAVDGWTWGRQVTSDDNFYISRVKPHRRFYNANTQVNKLLSRDKDKRLIAWLPFGDEGKNALPDGKFDSEVFSMWSYVDHWGDWSAPLGRIPAALMDVAHKNGVAVSSVLGIPNASVTPWSNEYFYNFMTNISQIDPATIANFMYYYGIDGLGYNSEFYTYENLVTDLQKMHAHVVKALKEKNPLVENVWYDGTGEDGGIYFDQGLGVHNKACFGEGGDERCSLFFNYNSETDDNYQSTVQYAKNMHRDPLYIYQGMNMQGGQADKWTTLAKWPISIGLWGAHGKNMFWQDRGEKGSDPETQQQSYLMATERWFSNGNRNPAKKQELVNKLTHNVDNTDFHGMSALMSARSALSWNLDDEPFVTHFNLGNGKFFNWMGKRVNDRQWANVGVQDYLPTWRYWFSSKLLGGDASDVPANGLSATFTWKDAYVGGSTMQIEGSANDEYLHLFKTKYALKEGDRITLTYKLVSGKADMNLVLTADGAENMAVNEDGFKAMTTELEADGEEWITKTFTVGQGLAGKELALIALHFRNASGMKLYLGEFSIVREGQNTTTPAKPKNLKGELLAYNGNGVDAKLTFDMQNSKPEGEPCYNTDVNTSVFKLYAQQEGGSEQLIGITTSWAGLFYAIPVDVADINNVKVRLGVRAVSQDMKTESDIAWTDFMQATGYVYNDDIEISQPVIKPGEDFSIRFVDKNHEDGEWTITDAEGAEITTGNGKSIKVEGGLPSVGMYTLKLKSAYGTDRAETGRIFKDFIAISGEEVGAMPKILTLTANDKEADITVAQNTAVALAYTGKKADGIVSRGMKMEEKPVGILASKMGMDKLSSTDWTISFWVKFNSIDGNMQMVDLRSGTAGWPFNNWGTIWSSFWQKEKMFNVTIRERMGNGSPEYQQNWTVDFSPKAWYHIALTFTNTSTGTVPRLFINGKAATPLSWKYNGQSGTGLNSNGIDCYAWRYDNMLLLGVGRGGTSPIPGWNGTIDDVKFFDTALNEEAVAKTMSSNDTNEGHLRGYWDFETDAADDFYFASKGQDTSIPLAHGEMVKGEAEGSERFSATAPKYDAGSVYCVGSVYKVVTKPSWKTSKATITESNGTDTEGSAKVAYKQDGMYDITLTLENSYGKDTRTFTKITVDSSTGINDTKAGELRTYTAGEEVLIECAENGSYTFSVFDLAGQAIISKTFAMSGGNTAHLHLPKAGVYLLKVKKDGKMLRTIKFLRK